MNTIATPARTSLPRVLVVTLDALTQRMAGPAIRAWEISSHLAERGHRVRLVTFGKCERSDVRFGTAQVSVESFRAEVEGADVVIIQGFVAATFPWLKDVPQCLVVDLYDPFQLESLEVEKYKPLPERHAALANALRELSAQSVRGDYFICASEKQRDLWIGHLALAGRVNPETYDADPSLRSLLGVVPFGTSDSPAIQSRHAIKGVIPGIGEDDPVILWGGGVYNWFDPLTAIRAVVRVRDTIPNVRLFFLGMKHPNPDVPEMTMAVRTRALADELGLTGTTVFFHEDWVVYEDRVNYLKDADVGISTHFDHVETSFSFRTRILDYLWAGLPIACTAGDSFGDLVAAEDLGVVVSECDDAALAAGILDILNDAGRAQQIRDNVARVAERYTWSRSLTPLLDYCAAPRRAADAARLTTGGGYPGESGLPVMTKAGIALRSAVRVMRTSGVSGVISKTKMRLARSGRRGR